MSSRIDIEQLVAYADGELDDAETRALEAELAGDEEARLTVRDLRSEATLLRAAFNEPMRSPAPDRIYNAIVESLAERARDSSRELQAVPSQAVPSPAAGPTLMQRWLPTAIAASVALLAVGLSGGYMLSDYRGDREAALVQALHTADRQLIAATLSRALEKQLSGVSVEWSNPDSGSSGVVTPVRTFRSNGGQWCREFTQVSMVDGQAVTMRGVACREDGGVWKTRLQLVDDI